MCKHNVYNIRCNCCLKKYKTVQHLFVALLFFINIWEVLYTQKENALFCGTIFKYFKLHI